jgi:uncharacterized membrane protein
MNDWKPKFKMRLPALVLLVATVVFWSFYDRYEPDGPMLLESPVLADATRSSGEVSEAAGRFTLKVPELGKRADVRFRLPAATDYSNIRVRARIRVEGVGVGKYRWRRARLVFLQYDPTPRWMPGHHGLMGAAGTEDWEAFEDVFEMFPGAAYAEVALQQMGTSGLAEFEHIEVQPVRVRASFVGWRLLFFGTWMVAAIYYFPRCRLHRRRLKRLIFLNVLAIVFGAMMPAGWIEEGSEWAKKTYVEWVKPAPEKTEIKAGEKPTEKRDRDTQQMDRFNELVGGAHGSGHFILFASLCFLVYLSAALERQHPLYFLKVGFDVLLFAAVTESLQFLTLDRTAGLGDLKTDLYGMGAAFVLFLAMFPLIRHLQKD